MKWLATILFVYLTVLFTVPCSDASNSCTNFNGVSEEELHNHQQDEDDFCTPFCQCSCCSISAAVFYFKLPELNTPVQVIPGQKEPVWKVHFVSSYFGNIWQPPKI